eukprot:845319-Pleurochrysis_carterae.AAC.4
MILARFPRTRLCLVGQAPPTPVDLVAVCVCVCSQAAAHHRDARERLPHRHRRQPGRAAARGAPLPPSISSPR